MRIIFVRHGEPDYGLDCLTPAGRQQAAGAAERLLREGITAVYASPMGRARETASFTAARLGLPVQTLEFMHEVSWGGPGVPEDGHPWTLADRMIAEEDFDFRARDWRRHRYFAQNSVTADYDRVSACFDSFLLGHGYRHEGGRFFCRAEESETFAVFSHGGSDSVL